MTGRDAPVVTYSIIAVTLLVFVLQILPFGIGGAVTDALLYAGIYSHPANFEPWRMITSVFVHSTGFILHIAFNMYTLWIFGQLLERMLGRGRFLALYLISGFAGSVAVLWLTPPLTAVVGASGAIFGLIGAFFVINRKLGGDSRQLIVLLVINVVLVFIPGMSISWQAHLGGLVGGALVGLIYFETRKREQKTLQRVLLAALSVVLILLSLRYFFLPLG